MLLSPRQPATWMNYFITSETNSADPGIGAICQRLAIAVGASDHTWRSWSPEFVEYFLEFVAFDAGLFAGEFK